MTAALGRAATSPRVFVLAALCFVLGTAGGTLAEFNAESQHPATFAGGWLDPPAGLQAPTLVGNGATLQWTPGVHGVADQALYGTDRGTTSNCTGASYGTLFASGLGVSTTTYTDDRGSAAGGHWICYQLRSVHGSWSSGASFAPIQVGLVPTTLGVTYSWFNHWLFQGSSIAITYNQPIAYSGGNIHVCAFTSGVILLGDATTGGSCGAASDTPVIGKITGLGVGTTRDYNNSTVAVSGGSQLTVTLGSAGFFAGSTLSGTGTFVGAGSPTSNPGNASACTTATVCTPSTGF
jgi:hypothetical protein